MRRPAPSPAIQFATLATLGVAAAVLSTTLGACASSMPLAAHPGASNVPIDVRVLVKLVEPSGDASAIAADASQRAEVPVRYVTGVSGVWHSISLHCSDEQACGLAIERLRQARGLYEAVELEGRKQRAVM